MSSKFFDKELPPAKTLNSGFDDDFVSGSEFNRQATDVTRNKSENSLNALDISEDHFGAPQLSSTTVPNVTAPGPLAGDAEITPRTQQAKQRSSFYIDHKNDDNRNLLLIEHFLRNREKEYVDYNDITLFVGTYNVNGQLPPMDLEAWLVVKDLDPPDIYAIGFQELDLSQQAFIFDTSPREDEWAKTIYRNLHQKAEYVELRRIRLVGMLLLVYVKKQMRNIITKVHATGVGTGLLNRMGNKGGVAVSLKIHDSWLVFINSHLAAHFDEVERRNSDFHEICKLKFMHDDRFIGVFNHDLVMWLGDLNYRLQTPDLRSPSMDMVKNRCVIGDFKALLDYDQLKYVSEHKKAFADFQEGAIHFMPTYKYDPGSLDTFDSSEKCRVPAWCDRILWKIDSANAKSVRQLRYNSAPTVKVSDHKPVYSCFVIQVKKIHEKKFKEVMKQAIKDADRLENEFLPQVTLNKLEFVFENVKFLEPVVQELTVKNVGQADLVYTFSNKPGETAYCKDWLVVSPETQLIPKGQTCVITLQAFVSRETAWRLNAGTDTLSDILVLHLQGGKDCFITVSGNYVPSCFARPLEEMVNKQRAVEIAPLIDFGEEAVAETTHDLPIPREMWRLVNHIRTYGMDTPALFHEAGRTSEFPRIRDCLDTGVPEKIPGNIHSITEALCRMLDALPEPVIPLKYTARCFRAAPDINACKLVLKELPEVHRNVFKYLMRFLREILAHSAKNKTDVPLLAEMFGPIVLRISTTAPYPTVRKSVQIHEQRAAAAQFLVHFLLHDYDD